MAGTMTNKGQMLAKEANEGQMLAKEANKGQMLAKEANEGSMLEKRERKKRQRTEKNTKREDAENETLSGKIEPNKCYMPEKRRSARLHTDRARFKKQRAAKKMTETNKDDSEKSHRQIRVKARKVINK